MENNIASRTGQELGPRPAAATHGDRPLSPARAFVLDALRDATASVQAALKEEGAAFDPIKVDNLLFEIELLEVLTRDD